MEKIDILFQDSQLVAVNKPAGLSVLADGWDGEKPYLAKLLELEYGRIWIVHRLDKVTSGVMIFALNAEAHKELSRQFEQHETQKIYHALAIGDPPWQEKTAKHPLRVNVGHKHRTAVDPRHGKPSETHFKVLSRYGNASLVDARPVTGRTHQVRAHLSALGYPILADVLYGGEPSAAIARPALHALSLGITPPGGARATFSAPYPEDFEVAIKQLSGLE